MQHTEKEIEISKGKCCLRVEANKDYYSFFYSNDNENFQKLGQMDVRYLSSETAGGFTGIYLALYAASQKSSACVADFDWFDYSF